MSRDLSVARTPQEIMSEQPWLNDRDNESFNESMTSWLGNSSSSDEIKQKVYDQIIRFLSSNEAREAVTKKRELFIDNPEMTAYFQEADIFLDHLKNSGFSDVNLVHCLSQANTGCFEDPYGRRILDMARDFRT